MIYELKDYQRIQHLFKGVHLNLFIDSVIEGNTAGVAWVDNPVNPETAFTWDRRHCYYLVGCASNEGFNRDVEEILTKNIIPEAMNHHFNFFKVYYTDDWEDTIRRIFQNSVKRNRTIFAFAKPRADLDIPPGFSLRRIDENLGTNIRNSDKVYEEILSMWTSLEQFLRQGFGFCLVKKDEIVCWCTAEYVSRNCGIGIETVEGYRNRGLATVTASAFVNHCISRRIVPRWDSWSNNMPSIRVARKVGFEKIMDYSVYFGSFDEIAFLEICPNLPNP